MASRETFNGAPLAILGLASIASLLFALAVLRMITGTVPSGHREHGARAQAVATEGSAQGSRPAPITRVVSCEKLPDAPGKSVTTAVVDFPPGGFSPRHRHPGSVNAYVLKGTLNSQLGGGAVGTFTSGQTWFEPPGSIHLFVENPSATVAASLLAVFVTDNDCGPLTLRD